MSTRHSAPIQINETNFVKEVLQSPEPVLVDFWAEWCGPCKALALVVSEIAVAYSDRLKVAQVNVDENPALAEHYGIRSIPTLLYFADGELRRHTVGAVGRQRIVDDLEAVGIVTHA